MPYPNQYTPQYPYSYQPQVQPPMDMLSQLQAQQYQAGQQMPMTQQQANQGILWTRGDAGAKSWIVAPGQSALLMDSEEPVFYIKSVDNAGMPLPLRIFDYKERKQDMPQETPQSTQETQTNLDDKYVTRKEYDDLQGKYAEILNRLDNFPVPSVVPDDGKKPATAANKSRNRGGNSNE